jgi:hypothetical protein
VAFWRAAHRVGVELHELAEPARPRLLVAVDVGRPVAAIGLRQRVKILRHVTGERSGEIVARLSARSNTAICSSSSWNENTPSLGRSWSGRNLPSASFERRRLHRLEAVKLVDPCGSSPSSAASPRSRPARDRPARAAAAASTCCSWDRPLRRRL